MMRNFLLAALLAVLAANPAFSADKGESKNPAYGDWGKTCEKGGKGLEGKEVGEVCYIFQNISNKENGKLVMQVRIGMAPEKKQPVLIVTLPLGVLIPPGAALIVEGDTEPMKLPFLACAPEGCTTVGQVVKGSFLESMKKGEKAAVRVALINRKVLNLPVSLKGFTRAYAALTAGQ